MAVKRDPEDPDRALLAIAGVSDGLKLYYIDF